MSLWLWGLPLVVFSDAVTIQEPLCSKDTGYINQKPLRYDASLCSSIGLIDTSKFGSQVDNSSQAPVGPFILFKAKDKVHMLKAPGLPVLPNVMYETVHNQPSSNQSMPFGQNQDSSYEENLGFSCKIKATPETSEKVGGSHVNSQAHHNLPPPMASYHNAETAGQHDGLFLASSLQWKPQPRPSLA